MRKLNKVIIMNGGVLENRVATLENGVLDEYFVEQTNSSHILGDVYQGVVESIVPGICAAFVNIGTGKNGFLFLEDVRENSNMILDDADDISFDEKKSNRNQDLAKVLKVGQVIMVQVVKEPIGTKGPRLTTHVSIPGRYLVLTPFDASIGISKKISDPQERARIRNLLKLMNWPDDIGCIVRTAAFSMPESSFSPETKYLLGLWERIKQSAKKVKAPALIHKEYNLVLRMIRDNFTDDVAKLVIDSREEHKNIMNFLNAFMPAWKPRVHLYNEKTAIFEKYGIENEIEKIFSKKISLKSGSSIFIEQTEGMVAIDVNTDKYVGKRNVEDTVFKTNMEAAVEIARQVRLRDIGGIIIIDFIDMQSREHRNRVQETLENALRRDKAKTKMLNISPIGVVEMTRQRVRRSLESSMYKSCPHCKGRGLVKSDTTVLTQIIRQIERSASTSRNRNINAWVHPDIYDLVMARKDTLLNPLVQKLRKNITFHKSDSANLENLLIN